jgi:hypothetical protein
MEPPNQKRSRLGCIGRSALGLLLLGGVGAVGFMGGQRFAPEPEPEAKSEPVVEERIADTATVLVAVRELARIETVAYHMERVIDLKQRQQALFGLIGADDWILLIAVGDVIAGVDLAKMRDGDVTVESAQKRVRVRLPPPELLSVSLDNKKTYVHSRKTDLMADRNDEIETRARRVAEDSIRNGALTSGILERARDGAQRAIEALLRSLGFEQIEIEQAGAER